MKNFTILSIKLNKIKKLLNRIKYSKLSSSIIIVCLVLTILSIPDYLSGANKCPTGISITTGAGGQALCQNATAGNITATATLGSGTTATNMTYQWYFNTTNTTSLTSATSVQTFTTTTGTTTNTLSAGNISTATAGTYYYFCVLSDATCGVTVNTATVTITVNALPSITTQPVSSPQILAGAGTATFTAGASGYGTLSYQWQQNSGSSWANVSTASMYSGGKHLH